MGTFLGFKMSKSRGREEKIGQKKAKKAEKGKKEKLGNMKTPTNLWGFLLAIFYYKTGEKTNFWIKGTHQVGPPHFPDSGPVAALRFHNTNRLRSHMQPSSALRCTLDTNTC